MKHVKSKMVGDVAVLYPEGTFAGGGETDELHVALLAAFDQGRGKLVVNFKDTVWLNSTALGVLIAGHTHYTKKGGRICICKVSKRIHNIFQITKLVMVFDTYESEAKAVASFKNWKPPQVHKETAAAR